MPTQQRVRGDEAVVLALPREAPSKGCQDGPVWSGKAWTGDLSAHHRDLLPEHEELGALEACPRVSSASQPRS
jgi:hypothetical protein